ncbi:protein serine threonine kinase [Stylonychia lemnae]|uniref:Protein serine threonine kinase n=1 Tax=Stylonychia lemnae TaxID=5949 RepID=A0A078B9I8_STYLE|nr:protein serine threonine kinase [Stylonychia lemnae]|eukprot:CDW91089.1 protein serine threonine kinase [Stylonychia lemnae]
MESSNDLIQNSSGQQTNEASEWIYEYCFQNDTSTRSQQLDQFGKSGDQFQGKGKDEEQGEFEFIGQIKEDQFKIEQLYISEKDQDKIIEGHLMQDGTLVGKWKYTKDRESANNEGDFVIRNVSNIAYALTDKCPEYLKLTQENIPCKCQNELIKQDKKQDQSQKCSLCTSDVQINYYTCEKCNFLICYLCFQKIQYMSKSELISIILNNSKKSDVTNNIDYIRGIYRKAFCDSERARSSIMRRKGRDYKWFEVYYLDENSLEFKKKENIELYVDSMKFAQGYFFQVKQCNQTRRFADIRSPDQQQTFREINLDPEVHWAIKNKIRRKHIHQIPNNIAKQYLAKTLAENFNRLLNKIYPEDTYSMNYIQPYILLPMFEVSDNQNIYKMENFQETDQKFQNFNRPKQELKVIDEIFGEAKLPNAFTHWTYAATGNRFMITDVKGWQIEKGHFNLIGAIVFSTVGNQLGLIDWGQIGTVNWMMKHVCNDICNDLPMIEDQNLIEQCMNYMEKFQNNSFNQQINAILGSRK